MTRLVKPELIRLWNGLSCTSYCHMGPRPARPSNRLIAWSAWAESSYAPELNWIHENCDLKTSAPSLILPGTGSSLPPVMAHSPRSSSMAIQFNMYCNLCFWILYLYWDQCFWQSQRSKIKQINWFPEQQETGRHHPELALNSKPLTGKSRG